MAENVTKIKIPNQKKNPKKLGWSRTPNPDSCKYYQIHMLLLEHKANKGVIFLHSVLNFLDRQCNIYVKFGLHTLGIFSYLDTF